MFDFGKKKNKKENKARKGVKPWDEGKVRNERYRRSTGPDTHALLEAQRMRRGGSVPEHYLKRKKR